MKRFPAQTKGLRTGEELTRGTPERRGPGQGLDPWVELPLASLQTCQRQPNRVKYDTANLLGFWEVKMFQKTQV